MRFHVLAALAAFVLLPLGAVAQQAPPVQPGMQFTGTLMQTIDSKTANVGDPVTLTNVSSTDGSIQNATMTGHVAAVTRAGQGRNAQILLQFDSVQLPNGNAYAVNGEVTQFQVNTKNNGGKEAVGALGGMIVGNILGKWAGTNLGGAIGAAGGYVIAKNNKENVTIPQNSSVNVRLVPPRPQQQQYPPQYPPQPQYAPATPLPR